MLQHRISNAAGGNTQRSARGDRTSGQPCSATHARHCARVRKNLSGSEVDTPVARDTQSGLGRRCSSLTEQQIELSGSARCVVIGRLGL